MFGTIQRPRAEFPGLKILLAFRHARMMQYSGIRLRDVEVYFLIAVMMENRSTNDFAPLKRIRHLLGLDISLGVTIENLLTLGLMERPSTNKYVTTEAGEYFLRDIETGISRIVSGRGSSKWDRIHGQEDPRFGYARRPRVRGAELVSRVKKKNARPLKEDRYFHKERREWDHWGNARRAA